MRLKPNKRIRKAYDVLNRGGYWRTTLERTFTGKRYVTRLHNRYGDIVKGAGPKTFDELRGMDLLIPRSRDVHAGFALDETMFLDWMTIQGITHPDQILTMHCDMNAVKRGLNCNFAEEWTLKGATS